MPKITSDKTMQMLLCVIALEGVVGLIALVLIPAPGSSALFGLSVARLLLAGSLVTGALLAVFLFLRTRANPQFAQRAHSFLGQPYIFPLVLIASLTGMAICLLWRFADPRYLQLLLRAFPVLLFFTLTALQTLILHLWIRKEEPKWKLTQGAFVILLVGLYLTAAFHYSGVNREYWLSDQEAYLEFARAVEAKGFRYSGDRAFMPLYPYLQAAFIDFSQEQHILYDQAKSVNIWLSLCLLTMMFLVARKYFNIYLAAFFTVILAFTLYLYKAAYVQPELLYYNLFFVSLLLLARLLWRPDWLIACIAGVLLAVAHLTKASVLPLVGLFTIFSLAKLGCERFQSKTGVKSTLRLAGIYSLVIVLFLGVLSPYLLESKHRFGQYFFNVNSTLYIWYDSWSEVLEGTRAHGDSVSKLDLRPDQIPSLQNYLATHTVADIFERFRVGLVQQAHNISNTYAALSFPLLAIAAAGAQAYRNPRSAKALLHKYWLPAAFTLCTFAAYILLFSWYSPIANYSDRRFLYGLYAPILFTCFWVIQALERNRSSGSANWTIRIYVLMAIILAADIVLRVPLQLLSFHWYGK